MKIVIDVTAAKFELVLNPSKRADCIEGDATVSRTYSVLTLQSLQRLYANTTGFVLASTDYNAALQACKYLAIRLVTKTGGYTYDLEKEACEASAKEDQQETQQKVNRYERIQNDRRSESARQWKRRT